MPRDLKAGRFLALAQRVIEPEGTVIRIRDRVDISHPFLLEYLDGKGKTVRVYVTHSGRGKSQIVLVPTLARGIAALLFILEKSDQIAG